MKTIITSVITTLVIVFAINLISIPRIATKNDLNQTEQRLKKEIVLNRQHIIIVEKKVDTLQNAVKQLRINQDTIKTQLYQLQNGQIVIYQAVQDISQSNDAKQRFLQSLANLLNIQP